MQDILNRDLNVPDVAYHIFKKGPFESGLGRIGGQVLKSWGKG